MHHARMHAPHAVARELAAMSRPIRTEIEPAEEVPYYRGAGTRACGTGS
eukprot:COSAG02_NODE_30055_length_558_cov_0.766885_2_plen_48_part_01